MRGRMKRVFQISLFLFVFAFQTGCSGQAGSQVQDRDTNSNEVSFESGSIPALHMPRVVSAVDTSPGWNQRGEKLLLTGTVYKPDGKTPMPGVLIYYYQTNTAGKYVHNPKETRSMPPNDLGQTHGYIRGWVRSDANGKYSVYTVRPGTYPTNDEPAHIHLTVRDPGIVKEYYIDDVVFDDDKLLTTAKRTKMENRGGSGVLRMVKKGSLFVGERNIILGLNIPDYPDSNTGDLQSGKSIGEDVFSFTPFHAWGPDKGTKTCPICKYGWYHGILYFAGNNPDWAQIRQWLNFLESESNKREKYLKVYFVYGNESGYDRSQRENELAQVGQELQLNKVALTFVPSFKDKDSDIHLNKINPETENTFILYRRSRIIDKHINLKPNEENFALIAGRLDQTINEYFYLEKDKE